MVGLDPRSPRALDFDLALHARAIIAERDGLKKAEQQARSAQDGPVIEADSLGEEVGAIRG